eukprot:scaffold49006_cov49-Phaeocystis_antarctica.AAC.2
MLAKGQTRVHQPSEVPCAGVKSCGNVWRTDSKGNVKPDTVRDDAEEPDLRFREPQRLRVARVDDAQHYVRHIWRSIGAHNLDPLVHPGHGPQIRLRRRRCRVGGSRATGQQEHELRRVHRSTRATTERRDFSDACDTQSASTRVCISPFINSKPVRYCPRANSAKTALASARSDFTTTTAPPPRPGTTTTTPPPSPPPPPPTTHHPPRRTRSEGRWRARGAAYSQPSLSSARQAAGSSARRSRTRWAAPSPPAAP